MTEFDDWSDSQLTRLRAALSAHMADAINTLQPRHAFGRRWLDAPSRATSPYTSEGRYWGRHRRMGATR